MHRVREGGHLAVKPPSEAIHCIAFSLHCVLIALMESVKKMRFPRFSTPLRAIPRIACCSLLFVFVSASLFQAFMSPRYMAEHQFCMGNMKVVSASVLQYAQDWDETLPPAQRWADAASKHIPPGDDPRAFHCPAARSPYNDIFNLSLGGVRLAQLDLPASTPMLYEGDSWTLNAVGDGKTPAPLALHYSFCDIAFVDGHVQSKHLSAIEGLTWKIEKAPAAETRKTNDKANRR